MARIKNEKNHILYHIQNMNITSDGEPYDVFVYGDEDGFDEYQLRQIAMDEFYGTQDKEIVDEEVEEFVRSSNVYTVWADDIDDIEKR